MKRIKARHFVGVDVGGSKIMAGLFTEELKLLESIKVGTKAYRGPKEVIERIVRCVRSVTDDCGIPLKQVRAIGVGSPGVVDTASGRVIVAPNLHWKNIALAARLRRALGRPVVVDNDCTAAMRGIYDIELKRRPRHAIGLFLGTGIGGALVLNGELYTGDAGIAGEVGHMTVDVDGPLCACGNRGCFEVYASRSGMVRRLRAAVKGGAKTSLLRLLEQDRRQPGTLRSGALKKALRQGDPLVRRIVREAAGYTGLTVANLINLLTPEVVVLGGGVVEALWDQMAAVTIRKAREHSLVRFLHEPKIVASKLADQAGIVGAAVIARERYGKAKG